MTLLQREPGAIVGSLIDATPEGTSFEQFLEIGFAYEGIGFGSGWTLRPRVGLALGQGEFRSNEYLSEADATFPGTTNRFTVEGTELQARLSQPLLLALSDRSRIGLGIAGSIRLTETIVLREEIVSDDKAVFPDTQSGERLLASGKELLSGKVRVAPFLEASTGIEFGGWSVDGFLQLRSDWETFLKSGFRASLSGYIGVSLSRFRESEPELVERAKQPGARPDFRLYAIVDGHAFFDSVPVVSRRIHTTLFAAEGASTAIMPSPEVTDKPESRAALGFAAESLMISADTIVVRRQQRDLQGSLTIGLVGSEYDVPGGKLLLINSTQTSSSVSFRTNATDSQPVDVELPYLPPGESVQLTWIGDSIVEEMRPVLRLVGTISDAGSAELEVVVIPEEMLERPVGAALLSMVEERVGDGWEGDLYWRPTIGSRSDLPERLLSVLRAAAESGSGVVLEVLRSSETGGLTAVLVR